MSDLRDELEQNFASVETQSENSNVTEEQPQTQEPVIDEWMDAPKSYTKEYQENFKTLSPEWRKYLTEREKQVEKGFSELGNKANAYNWVNDAFNARQERLAQNGINKAQDYFNILMQIDDLMSKEPAKAIQMLADSYGVKFGETNSSLDYLKGQVSDIQKILTNQQAYLKAQQTERANREIDTFVNDKDEAGNLKHPYFEDVRQEMISLIKSGMSKTLDDAYNKAVYLNENVRNKLIAAQSQAELQNKVVEAGKAKNAGFNPTSKSEPEKKEKTLREELEDAFNKVG